jgi:short subunit dehydrogenase-like uncharacterized protein
MSIKMMRGRITWALERALKTLRIATRNPDRRRDVNTLSASATLPGARSDYAISRSGRQDARTLGSNIPLGQVWLATITSVGIR